MYDWATILYSRNWDNAVNQTYLKKKNKHDITFLLDQLPALQGNTQMPLAHRLFLCKANKSLHRNFYFPSSPIWFKVGRTGAIFQS